jgi:hypothetical protein
MTIFNGFLIVTMGTISKYNTVTSDTAPLFWSLQIHTDKSSGGELHFSITEDFCSQNFDGCLVTVTLTGGRGLHFFLL